MELAALLDLYQQRRVEKEPALLEFFNTNQRKYIVIQRPPADMWGACNSVEQIYRNNIAYLERALQSPWTDDLPYLEPWIGVGVYANAFGCEYFWRDDNAPDTHYRYHTIEAIRNLEYPDYHQSLVMQMVLDCIDCFKERTRGQIPIALTDTQSPFDTATLVLSTSEFFTACYTEEETILKFMQLLTDLLIEFSRAQLARIGEGLAAKPGHIMPSSTAYRGISISDDNLAVSSPKINEKIALPFDQQIADAFNGLAIHSCGKWTQTMQKLKNLRQVLMIDCTVDLDCDPTPNTAAEVREALKGSGIIAKVRVGSQPEVFLRQIEDLYAPDLKLAVELNYDEQYTMRNYRLAHEKLTELYGA